MKLPLQPRKNSPKPGRNASITSNAIPALIKDAQLFLNNDRLDEAAALLDEVLAVEPVNAKALEYSNLIQEKRRSLKEGKISPAKIPLPGFQPISPTKEVQLEKLSSRRDVSVKVLDETASTKATAPNSNTPEQNTAPLTLLHTRTFKIDKATIVEALRKVYPPPGSPQWPTEDVNETHSRAAQDTNGVTEIINMLPDFLKAAGADLASPKSIFFNERLGLLMVRATRKDLDIIEQVIQVLNSSPPQLMIEVKFCEMTQADKDPAGLSWLPGTILTSNSAASTSSGILTESQFRKVSQMLAEKRGVDLLSTPKVTTLSGRQAQIKVVDVKYIVTDLNVIATNRTQTGTGEISAIVSPITEPMEFGAVLAVVPYISADGYTIQMTVNASIKEFLGYEPALTMPCNPPTTPRPKIRQRLVTTTANVYDGQTLVLQGGSSSEIQKTSEKIPILGDLPLAGRLFRSESSQITKKQLLIFVTPTAIDPAGNRVHSPEKMPPSTKGIPPQPAAPAK